MVLWCSSTLGFQSRPWKGKLEARGFSRPRLDSTVPGGARHLQTPSCLYKTWVDLQEEADLELALLLVSHSWERVEGRTLRLPGPPFAASQAECLAFQPHGKGSVIVAYCWATHQNINCSRPGRVPCFVHYCVPEGQNNVYRRCSINIC